MRTVLGRTAGRASLILVATGMVGSAALLAVPAAAGAATHVAKTHSTVGPAGSSHKGTQIGTAVKFVREPDGTVRQVRG